MKAAVWRWAAIAAVAGLGLGVSSQGFADRKPQVCGDADGHLRVMTFNIRTGLGTELPGKNPLHLLFAKHDVAPVIAAIAAADPDVVALQEVLGVRQAREIAAALQMQSSYVSHPSPVPWWGTALLSKCQLKGKARVVTSQGAGNGKSMAMAEVMVQAGDMMRPVTVTSLHRDRDDNSGRQVERFLAPFVSAETSAVLMGDFNFVPDDPRHARVARWFDDTGQGGVKGGAYVRQRGTYPVVAGSKTHRRIDYVFASKGDFDVLEVGVVEGTHSAASDHLAYVVDLKLKPKAK